ncbi:hypothetical protein Tco_0116756 [Tanacetum coccineum]
MLRPPTTAATPPLSYATTLIFIIRTPSPSSSPPSPTERHPFFTTDANHAPPPSPSPRHYLHKGAFGSVINPQGCVRFKNHHKGAFGFDYYSTKGALGSRFGFYNIAKGAFGLLKNPKRVLGWLRDNANKGAFGLKPPHQRGALVL